MNRYLLVPIFAASVAWSCTQDKGLSVHNLAPNVTIHQPSNNATFFEGEMVEFLARIGDDIDAPEDLIHTWSSDIQPGLEDTSTVDESGDVAWATSSLIQGDHSITLQVVDQDGLAGTSSVDVTIGAQDFHPTIEMIHPTDGDYGEMDVPFDFVAEVWDDDSDPDDLEVSFEVVSGDTFCTPIPNPDGEARCSHVMEPGNYFIIFRVEDADGLTGETSAQSFEVRSEDLDGDGWTVDDGDCDDNDALVFPGADEICDDQDNDCDGTADEEDAEGCSLYYLDEDRDGFGVDDSRCLCVESGDYTTTDNTDCDDDEFDANPDFSGWKTEATAAGQWDWNCDGSEEKQYTGVGECAPSGLDCDASVGWEDVEADCGELAVYITGCSGFPCSADPETRRQACR